MEHDDYPPKDFGSRTKDELADLSETAAQQARRFGDQMNEGINRATEVVEQQTDRAVAWLRDLDVRKMMNDVGGYVKSHPTQALVGAVILGFVTGRLIRRG